MRSKDVRVAHLRMRPGHVPAATPVRSPYSQLAVSCRLSAAASQYENNPTVWSSGSRSCLPAGGEGSAHAAIASADDSSRAIARSNTPAAPPETELREGTNTHSAQESRHSPRRDEHLADARETSEETAESAKLIIISANVQKSRDNMHALLEQHQDADIICVQEPCWGYVKHIVSSTSKEGDPTNGTAHHRRFLTLGAAEASRVVVFVQREKWARASPRVRSTSIKHDDVLCISISIDGSDFSFLNVYNDSRTAAALTAITDHAQNLPRIDFMVGDFNIRHPMWDKHERRLDAPGTRHLLRQVGRGQELISLATEHLGLSLANKPNGPPTWYSNNLGVREGVIDLLWVNPERGTLPDLHINDLGRGASDHAILEWNMAIAAAPCREPRVPMESAAGREFVRQCRQGIAAMPKKTADQYSSAEEVEQAADTLEKIFKDAWEACAEPPKPSKRSKSWWNADCSALAKTLRKGREELKALQHTRTAIQRRLREAGELLQDQWITDIANITRLMHATSQHNSHVSKQLKGAQRRARRTFYNSIIQDTDPARVWSLVGWTRPGRADATASLTDATGRPAESQEDLGRLFQEQFTPANPREVDLSLLDEFEQAHTREFPPMSAAEMRDALARTSNHSAPGPDHVSWYWLKHIVSDQSASTRPSTPHDDGLNTEVQVLALFNACIQHGVHPRMFKVSCTVVIPKPNKTDYTKAKAYRPIVLLNCIGKLLEKIIARRMQFDGQQAGVLHPCQYGGTSQHSTVDAGIQLVHNVKEAWRQGMDSSALLLDVAQFFPSIQHNLLAGILRKQGFSDNLCRYFENYLVGRKTQFQFNGSVLAPLDFSTGVGQGSALSPILTGLFIAPILHKVAATSNAIRLNIEGSTHTLRHDWTTKQMAANGHTTLQFFVDDGLIHVAGKLAPGAEPEDQLKYNNVLLKHTYGRLAALMTRAGLGIEADKLEVMHFVHRSRRKWSEAHPLGPALKVKHDEKWISIQPASTMRYLGFYLDPTLSFKEHVRFYATKGCSTVNTLRMLGNSRHGLAPELRRRIYLANVVPLLTYGAQLWWNPGWKGRAGTCRSLQQAQSRAVRWVTGAFRTTPIGAMEAFAGIMPIKDQIDKLMHCACLRTRTLHCGHPTRALLPSEWRTNQHNICAPLPAKLHLKRGTKSPVEVIHAIGARDCHEEFHATHAECRPGARVLDMFDRQILSHLSAPKKGSRAFRAWLEGTFEPDLHEALQCMTAVVLFTDGSMLKGDTVEAPHKTGAGFILRTPSNHGPAKEDEGSFSCGDVTPFDAEMLALAKGISLACQRAVGSTRTLHVYADNKAALECIVRPNVGPAQLCAVLACKHLRTFLSASPQRKLVLHWCPAHIGIDLNERVDELAKDGAAGRQPVFVSLARARQRRAGSLTEKWRARVQDTRYIGRQTLIPRPETEISPSATNWYLKNMGQHPREFARYVRFASGHFPCGAYRERFHLPGPSLCWWCKTVLDSRDHIMYDCPAWVRAFNIDKRPRAEHDTERWKAWATRRREEDRLDADPRNADHRKQALWMDANEIRFFLRINPAVATFEWGDLVAAAQADELDGHTAQTSIHMFKADALSGWRRRERFRWIERAEDKARRFGGSLPQTADMERAFSDWYAECIARFIRRNFATSSSVADLRAEFGHSDPTGAKATERRKKGRKRRDKEGGAGSGERSARTAAGPLQEDIGWT